LGIANADKAAEYTRYAEHCVETAKILPHHEARTLHREMAAEWIRLAQGIVEEAAIPSAKPAERRRKATTR
jgi:hypothetical protein